MINLFKREFVRFHIYFHHLICFKKEEKYAFKGKNSLDMYLSSFRNKSDAKIYIFGHY